MEPEGMRLSAEVAEVMIQAEAKMVAASENQEGEKCGEPHCFPAIVVVHKEVVCDPAHGATHPKRTDDQSPQHFVEHLTKTGKEQGSDDEKEDLCGKRVEPEENERANID